MGFEAESGTGGGGGTIGGSGTLNYVSKFTPNGTTLGDSLLFDNGTSIQQRFSPTVYLSTTVDSFGATTIGAVGSESAYGFQYTSPTGNGNFQITETSTGDFISIKPLLSGGSAGQGASIYTPSGLLAFFSNNGQYNFNRLTAGAVAFYTNARTFVLSATSAPDFFITNMGNVAIGNVALATNATDGFLHIPISNGTPTGVPTNITGTLPIEINYANNEFHFYNNSGWKTIAADFKGADIASAATTDLGTATGNYIHITGTTTITSFGTVGAGVARTLIFDGVLILTHNATSLILPGASNITTAAGDAAIFRSEGSGNWRCISYQTASDAYTNYTPAFTGFGTAPTIAAGDARWKMITRNTCHVIMYPTSVGVSTSTGFTVTLPFNAANTGANGQSYSIPVYNAGANVLGSMRTRLNSNIADVYNGPINSSFTASGNKTALISIVYQIEI